MSTHTHSQLLSQPNTADIYSAFNQPNVDPIPDIYLMLTHQMTNWMGSISQLGNWNIESGSPIILPNNNGKSYVNYIDLSCSYKGYPAEINCSNLKLDLNEGLLNNQPSLNKWAYAKDGVVLEVRQYTSSAPYSIQTLNKNNRLASQIMHQQLFDSAFNQLYNFANITTPGIELVYDKYPDIRIYKIIGTD